MTTALPHALRRSDPHPLMGHLRSVTEFLWTAIEGFRDTDFPAAVAAAVPWAGVVGEVVSDVVPPVRFVMRAFERWTKQPDPLVLGWLACTVAYQRAVEQAVAHVGRPDQAREVPPELRAQLKARVENAGENGELHAIDLGTFSLEDALCHPFVSRADETFRSVAEGVGYRPAQVTALSVGVRERFVPTLKALLSHGATAERFKPFTDLLGLGARERVAFAALAAHGRLQRSLFETQPLFDSEPFALSDVYVAAEAGRCTGRELTGRSKRVDPFREEVGGRHDLMEEVLARLADPKFRDAVVIQGAAGSGKTAFTLALCARLQDEGLRPVRVRLRDLRLDVHLREALPHAVEVPHGTTKPAPDALFLDGAIFRSGSAVPFRGARICPYVLVLDGWDELPLSVSRDFRDRVSRMLEQVRAEYLSPTSGGAPVRVILTGRPGRDLTESHFLRDATPVFSLRPLRPERLRELVRRVGTALDVRPLTAPMSSAWRRWDGSKLEPVLVKYTRDFRARARANAGVGVGGPDQKSRTKRAKGRRRKQHGAMDCGSLEVLGTPLLAHLALQVLAGTDDPSVADHTALQRALVDRTITLTGSESELEPETLRSILRSAAVAASALAQEAVTERELSARLEGRVTQEELLALRRSFHVRDGAEGIELLHASFREYLFAEELVETLKAWGLEAPSPLPERTDYWRDFGRDDPRFALSRSLGRLLGPHWLSRDVSEHLRALLSRELEERRERGGDLEPWLRVRDGLADLWDWWAEGVHLRPQPGLFAAEIIQWAAPQAPDSYAPAFEPKRTTTVDAHLGDGLFRLASHVHFAIAQKTGWLRTRGDWWAGASERSLGPRRCQTEVRRGANAWRLFQPAGADPRYFANQVNRINSAGWRPEGPFPSGIPLHGCDLRGAQRYLPHAEFWEDDAQTKWANLGA